MSKAKFSLWKVCGKLSVCDYRYLADTAWLQGVARLDRSERPGPPPDDHDHDDADGDDDDYDDDDDDDHHHDHDDHDHDDHDHDDNDHDDHDNDDDDDDNDDDDDDDNDCGDNVENVPELLFLDVPGVPAIIRLLPASLGHLV